MKFHQFLFLLALVPTVLLSCSKDDEDYRDQYEGTYDCDITGSITLNTDPAIVETIQEHATIVVSKSSSKSLTLSYGGDNMVLSVDSDGNLSSAPASGTISDTDPETGATMKMNVTVIYTGVITSRTLYLKETYSGTVQMTLGSDVENTTMSGNIIYNGIKR